MLPVREPVAIESFSEDGPGFLFVARLIRDPFVHERQELLHTLAPLPIAKLQRREEGKLPLLSRGYESAAARPAIPVPSRGVSPQPVPQQYCYSPASPS